MKSPAGQYPPLLLLKQLRNAHQEKQSQIENVNYRFLEKSNSSNLIVELRKVEVDEMASFCGKENLSPDGYGTQLTIKQERTHAFVIGRREDRMFLKLKRLLKPFRISTFYTDKLKTYERNLTEGERIVSKYKMPRIERKHLTLRTRITHVAEKNYLFFT